MDPRTPPDPHADDVLAAYRTGERLPAKRRDAAWQRLTAAIADEEAASAKTHRGRWLAGGVVLLAAAAVILVVGELRRSAGRQVTGADDQQAAHDLRAAPVEPVRKVRPAEALEHVVVPSQPPAAAPARAPEAKPTATPDADLGAELALLRAARTALASAAPEQALRELAEHQRRFPGGLLAEERMVLRVQALCESGATEQARAAAQEFSNAHPGSPHVASCDP